MQTKEERSLRSNKTSSLNGNDRSFESQKALNRFQMKELFSGPSNSNVSSVIVPEIKPLQAFTPFLHTSNCDDESIKNEPRCEKTGLRGFRPAPTQTRLYSLRRWLEALNFGNRTKRDCTIYVAKTKALICFAVTAKLICVFVFAYSRSRFSHDEAQMNKVDGDTIFPL